MSGEAPLNVDIVSDIVCPWCWLGARYFLNAAKNFTEQTGQTVKLNWRPYMLDSNIPEDGTIYADYMKAKFGDTPSNKWKAMRAHLEEAGPDAGINFRFSGIPMRPNTLRAHRLMRWAGGQGLGTDMAERLFKAFFEEHQDVGSVNVLSALANDVGLDSALTKELLETDRDTAETQAEMLVFREMGISGVPTFIYNKSYAVQGAQPAETHLAYLQKAAGLNGVK
ncbi:MAG: DsbA family oxidoreductase [Maricaulaceae bacterium]